VGAAVGGDGAYTGVADNHRTAAANATLGSRRCVDFVAHRRRRGRRPPPGLLADCRDILVACRASFRTSREQSGKIVKMKNQVLLDVKGKGRKRTTDKTKMTSN